ncbi:MAG: amino acid adenylation domain-containing protein [Butyrivibrio sp.]|nr:amino acid adenylation domain-containing protein [Butyrivibrio sp.]
MSETAVLSKEDATRLDALNETSVSYDRTETIVSLFMKAAAAYPDRPAVVYEENSYTYGELNRKSDDFAAAIMECGLGRGDVVSILIPRGEYEAIASLGALKAGCAYQPLDDSYPEERLNFMVEDAGARLLITTEELSGKITDYQGKRLNLSEVRAVSAAPKLPKVSPEDLFILLYTSGSTGVPKGVRLLHSNLVCFVDWYHRYYELKPEDCVGQYASYGFDACMMDMYPALTAGATLAIIPEDIRLNLNALNAYMEKHHITHQFMTTQVGRQYAMEASEPYLRHLSVGGEKLASMEPPKGFAFHNLYGPTECTILTTAYRVTEREADIPIGKPLDNIKLYIVNEKGERVPYGETGELWVAGPHVAGGYLNRPEKTAEVFLDNPFDDDPLYRPVYRTGDLVRLREDGNIVFVGREDGQVKIRGFRIELSEVEAVVRDYPGVRDATVAAFDSPSGGKYIVAYVVGDAPIDCNGLNAFIAERKPPYMVPASIMQLDAIPLTQNHKVNKKALPVPDFSGDGEDDARPATKCEEQLLELASRALGFELKSVNTDLVGAGMTSISSISLVSAIENVFHVTVSSKDILAGASIVDIENRIFEALLQQCANSAGTGERKERKSRYPLTQTQFGIYSECLMNPDSTMYNIPYSYRMDRAIGGERLQKAVKQVLDAHASIKCTIAQDENGDVYMYPHEERESEVQFLSGSREEAEQYWAHFIKPFDMAAGPLYRVTVYETPQDVILFFDFHHILFDGSSLNVFMRDLNAVLQGEEISKEDFTIFDVAEEEQGLLRDGAEERAKTYYDNLMRGCNGCTVPDGDLEGAEERCGEEDIARPELSVEAVHTYCSQHGVTENAFFLAAMGFVLQRYTYAEDVTFTTIYNGRSEARTEELFGMLVKTLPVRCFPEDGKRTVDYVKEVGRQILGNMANDLYSFARISRSSGLRADLMMVYQGNYFEWKALDGFELTERVGASNMAMADISMDVLIRDGVYHFDTQYRANKYSATYIRRMTDVLATAAQSMLSAETLGQVELTSEAELEIVQGFNQTYVPVEMLPVHRLFEAQAAAHGERPAIIAAGETLSYEMLNRQANRLAHVMLKKGIERESVVGLVLPRVCQVAVAEYGVWKAGGAFLPMVPDYPDDRIEYCLLDAGSRFVITTEAVKRERTELFAAGKPYETLTVEELCAAADVVDTNPGLNIDPESLAYCIYTSGSTGRPKGVMIEHRNLCNFVNANERNMETYEFVRGGERVLGLASISFDVSIMEMHITLTNGRTLVMASEEDIHNPIALATLLEQQQVRVIAATPSFLTNILEVEEVRKALAPVRMYDLGAEAFPAALFDKLRGASPEAVIVNGYGPTEATVSCIAKIMDSGTHITIGKPAANVRAYVCDSARHILPVGLSGELVIAGSGVGRGYVQLPEKTADVFIMLGEERAYRSGDLVRWNAEGELEFFGRLDNQVKLRGLRVELDEIENVMNDFDGIRMSKVIVRNNGKEDYLAGFFTADHPVDIGALTAHMKAHLTYYMVPAVLMQLEQMPLTVNKKIDKNALPQIDFDAPEREYVAPATALEKELCEAYEEVLSLERVGATDSFFEIGGTSLSATRIVMYAMNHGYQIVYRNVFDHPSPRALAAFISGESPEGEKSADHTDQANDKLRHVTEYDYTAINHILQKNVMEHIGDVSDHALGDIILTGATGFLGVHVLRCFIEQYEGKVYCLMRRGKYENCEKRLMNMLMYYYGQTYESLFGSRIFCAEGDITESESLDALSALHADLLINCAACVKHFVQDDLLDRINVGGVENLIELCSKTGLKMIQISTTSIAENGGVELRGRKLHENELYFGQSMENDYVRTKFLAERAVLQARADGRLDGKIIRVGNLMSRNADGEFQINFITNGFMRQLKAYRRLGEFPVSMLDDPQEFSPIDATAAAILTLARDGSEACVYHAYNNHLIEMADVIAVMRDYGFEIRVVPDETFEKAVSDAARNPEMSEIVLGILAYDEGEGEEKVTIGQRNQFTTNVLYRLGYRWPITDEPYLKRAIEALDTMGYFEKED